MNLWFHGGGFATIWSFGVAEEIKRLGIKTEFVGGYSAGAMVASYLLSPNEVQNDIIEKVCLGNKYSPYKDKFCMFGKAHILMKHLQETLLGDPLEFRKNIYDKKLYIPIRGLKCLSGTWRNSWRDYDDLVETCVSSSCIPGIHGEFSTCYYDDAGSRRGPTIDGGFFSLNPPKCWDKKETLVVSPWGNGDINMKPAAKLTDLAFPKYENLKTHFNLGISQCREYFS